LIEQTGVIGKLEIRNYFRRCFVGSYIHSGNKIATLVALSKNIEGAEEVEMYLCCSYVPIALDESVDADYRKEIEIAKDLLRQKKPEAIDIAKGKLLVSLKIIH
jgi:elongation factor Ts